MWHKVLNFENFISRNKSRIKTGTRNTAHDNRHTMLWQTVQLSNWPWAKQFVLGKIKYRDDKKETPQPRWCPQITDFCTSSLCSNNKWGKRYNFFNRKLVSLHAIRPPFKSSNQTSNSPHWNFFFLVSTDTVWPLLVACHLVRFHRLQAYWTLRHAKFWHLYSCCFQN